jgi:hypothetical protein
MGEPMQRGPTGGTSVLGEQGQRPITVIGRAVW